MIIRHNSINKFTRSTKYDKLKVNFIQWDVPGKQRHSSLKLIQPYVSAFDLKQLQEGIL